MKTNPSIIRQNLYDFFEEIMLNHDEFFDYNISYNPGGKYYQINIKPPMEEVDSSFYFKNFFEIESVQEKLGDFCIENKVGMVTY